MITLLLASVYGPPNCQTLTNSSNALWTCEYFGHEVFQVFPVTWIKSCVAMLPLKKPADEWFYVHEKMGLAVASMGGLAENVNGNEGHDDLDDMFFFFLLVLLSTEGHAPFSDIHMSPASTYVYSNPGPSYHARELNPYVWMLDDLCDYYPGHM